MPAPADETWLDGDAGRLVRPYAVSGGRTSPSKDLDLMTMVVATGVLPPVLEPDHQQVLSLCRQPVSVAEVAARLRLPAVVTKVLLSDLIEHGAVTAAARPAAAQAPDRLLLEKVHDALQRRL